MDFRVDLDIFRGPLDLLLYLVRKHEVQISEIPIAPITQQYLEYLEVLEQLEVDSVGDFLELASTLIEIKSRMILPRAEEDEPALEDPRHELIERLLQYKRVKDAASMLEQRAADWQQHFSRSASDTARAGHDLADEPIHAVELWDLVSALGRVLRDNASKEPSNIVYDDTPIHVYMGRVHALVLEKGRVPFGELFQPGAHKSTLIGLFLAVLELVRHHGVRVEQGELFDEMWIVAMPPADSADTPQDFSTADDYGHGGGEKRA